MKDTKMSLKKNFTTPNDSFLLFGIAIAVFFIVQFVLTYTIEVMIVAIWGGESPTALWLTIMGGTLSLGITTIILAKKRNFCLAKVTNITRAPSILGVLCALMMLVGILLFSIPTANYFVERLGIDNSFTLPTYGNNLDYVFLLLGVCILPAVCEELFLRGVVTTGLSRYGIPIASLLSGVLFMIFHMNPAQTVHQLVFGVALGYIMLRGGNIWTCIILHFVNNFTVLLLSAVMSEQLQIAVFYDRWYITVPVGILIALIGTILFTHVTKTRFDRGYEARQNGEYMRLCQDLSADVVPEKERISVGATISIVAGVIVCAVLYLLSLADFVL